MLHERGYAVAAAERSDVDAVPTSIERYGKGSLRLSITGFAVAPAAAGHETGPALEWITVEGEACIGR